jgi:hypothetical protein
MLPSAGPRLAHIIWRCWQDGSGYDPTRHGALQALLNQDQHQAA